MAKFKLTENDIALLRDWGEINDDDIKQIERCASKKWTKYELTDEKQGICKKISREEAIEILGRKEWLSGMQRCAFHCSAVRYRGGGCEGDLFVLFDAYNFFK